jgi:SDR family mycofactocin-dependent oxidoreductase
VTSGYTEDLLAGRVALVTGGARGQGRSHAVGLARAGADVVLCDALAPMPTIEYDLADPEDLDETAALVEAEGRRCVAERADVRDLGALRAVCERAMTELGRLDIVVANAGVYSHAPSTWELTEEQWDVMLDINLGGVWRTCAAAVPHVVATGEGGSVVLISSVNGLRGVPGTAHYNAAKHGLVGLTRTLALELARYGIRVNTLHPTGVRSPMTQNEAMERALRAVSDTGVDMTNLLDVDMLDPRDVTDALVWLVSPLARNVTGISLPVDAGHLIK